MRIETGHEILAKVDAFIRLQYLPFTLDYTFIVSRGVADRLVRNQQARNLGLKLLVDSCQ